MKNLLIAILLLVSVGAMAQTTYTITGSPQTITIGDTNTNIIALPGRWVDVVIFFPAANVGTVQLNDRTSVMTNATVLSNATHPNGVILRARESIRIKCSNAGDKVDVIIWE